MNIIGIEGLDGETWIGAVGFDGYMVSSHGRVVSLKRKTPRLMSFEKDKDGYLRLQLVRGARQVHVVVSRLVCEAFNGAPGHEDMVCCHRDGDTSNNHFLNLRWDTQKGNIADKLVHGTHQVGSKHPRSGITEDDARRVKAALLSFPASRGKLLHAVRETGVSYPAVADISRGKTWRHVRCE